MADEKPFSLSKGGLDYKTVVRLLFDPRTKLPPLAVIYTTDVDAAEASGAAGVKIVLAGIARDHSRMGSPHAGYHEREIVIPLPIARQLAHDDYASYLSWRDAQLAADPDWDER